MKPLVLLSVLPALALAAPPPYIWQVTGLQVSDQPVDPTQTGPTPALHHLQFSITDEQQGATEFCSATWANADVPSSLQKCSPVSGPTNNATFNFAVGPYYSAAGGSTVSLSEFVISVDVVFEYNGTFTESNGVDGGSCTYTPLQNKPDVTFASCSWPTFDVFATRVA